MNHEASGPVSESVQHAFMVSYRPRSSRSPPSSDDKEWEERDERRYSIVIDDVSTTLGNASLQPNVLAESSIVEPVSSSPNRTAENRVEETNQNNILPCFTSTGTSFSYDYGEVEEGKELVDHLPDRYNLVEGVASLHPCKFSPTPVSFPQVLAPLAISPAILQKDDGDDDDIEVVQHYYQENEHRCEFQSNPLLSLPLAAEVRSPTPSVGSDFNSLQGYENYENALLIETNEGETIEQALERQRATAEADAERRRQKQERKAIRAARRAERARKKLLMAATQAEKIDEGDENIVTGFPVVSSGLFNEPALVPLKVEIEPKDEEKSGDSSQQVTRSRATEKRPGRLNLPDRQPIERQTSASNKRSHLRSSSLALDLTSEFKVTAHFHSSSFSSPASEPSSFALQTPKSPLTATPQSPNTPRIKMSLKQLVSVSWLPKEHCFPLSKQARFEHYRLTAYSREHLHVMPMYSDPIEVVADRTKRSSLPGPSNCPRRSLWMLSQPKLDIKNAMSGYKERIPHRFWIEELIHEHQKPFRERFAASLLVADIPVGRVMGRKAVIALADIGESSLYHEIVIVDDGQAVDRPLCEAINTYVYLHHLIINDTKIVQSKLTLPYLLSLTLSNNKIASISTLTHLTLHTPMLSSLTIVNNPLNAKLSTTGPNGLPPIEHEIWKLVLLPLPSLVWFNGAKIDHATRFAAYQRAKQAKLMAPVSQALWHSALDSHAQFMAMDKWQPEQVSSLSLSGMSLMSFHVSPLLSCTNLLSLDLSCNHISSINNTALHTLPALKDLDLSDNELSNLNELSQLGQCSLLQSLCLSGNDGLKDYRSFVLYACRYLRGTEAAPGLQSLDRVLVSVDDKDRAYSSHDKVEAPALLWHMLCCAAFTYSNLLNQAENIVSICFNSQNISFADVTQMKHLQYLNLSNNKLRFVVGLDSLPLLKCCDLSGNSDLNQKAALGQLNSLTSLTHVYLASRKEEGARNDHFQKVLFALFPANPRLSCIDGRLIEVNDYVAVIKKISTPPMDEEATTEYRWALTLTLDYYRIVSSQLTAAKDKTLTAMPNTVQYTRENALDQITIIAPKLKELYAYNIGLTESISFQPFVHLSYLNLSGNRLSSLMALQVGSLASLLYVDVRNNRIKDSPQNVALALGFMHELKGVCLAGNPCTQQSGWRRKLMEALDSLANIHCNLKVIDTVITVEERMQAYIYRLQNSAERLSPNLNNVKRGSLVLPLQMKASQFRFMLCLQHTLPESAQFHLVNELVLVDQKLTYLDCSSFPRLRKLFIGKNELVSLKDTGLESLTDLVVLDVRSNKLTQLSELVDLFNRLKNIEFLGMRDNRFKEGNKSRQHLIVQVIQNVGHHHSLRFIDDIEIGPDELVNSMAEIGMAGVDQTEREKWRFEEITKEYLEPTSLTELNISNCKLQVADLTRFPNLVLLNLRNNSFQDGTLEEAGLATLTLLEHLDVSDNQLRSLVGFAQALWPLCKLNYVNILGNPMTTREERPRRQFLSFFPYIASSEFSINILNNEPITIEERINAFVVLSSRNEKGFNRQRHRHALSSNIPNVINNTCQDTPIHRQRRGESISVVRNSYSAISSPYITVEEKEVQNTSLIISPFAKYTNLILSSDVHFNAEVARYQLTINQIYKPDFDKSSIQKLRLRGLNLMYVGGASGLKLFSNIRSLDLRGNEMESLEQQGLEELVHLHTLDLRSNKIVSLQNIINALHPCHSLQVLALHRSTKTDETQVIERYIDNAFSNLRGLMLCDGYKTSSSVHSTPLSLSALNLLQKLNGVGPNQLHEVSLVDVHATKDLLTLVLSALYHLRVPRLRMDGDNDWCSVPEYSDLVIILMGKHLEWFDGLEISEDRRYLALQANERKKLEKQRLLWEEVWEEAHEKIDQFLIQRAENRKEKKLEKGKKQEKGKFFNANMPVTMSANASSGTSSIMSQSTTVLSSMLSKLEIVVQYVQVYSLSLSVDLHVPLPSFSLDLSVVTQWLALNVYDLINLDTEFAQVLVFALFVSIPLLFLGFFFWFHSLRSQQNWYARQFIDNWTRTRLLAALTYITSLMVSLALGVFVAGPGFNELSQNEMLDSQCFTVTLILGSACTIVFLLWFLVVFVFRYHYMRDRSEDKLQFRSSWMSLLNWGQILIMFVLTIAFMPISRVLLQQFLCSSGQSTCFPYSFTPIQGLSFVFAAVYICGLPIFYAYLINRAVKLVLTTSRTYQLNDEKIVSITNDWVLYQESYQKEKSSWNKAQLRRKNKEAAQASRNYHSMIKDLRRQQYALYYSIVNQPGNMVPSSSLYSAFTRLYRFWKIVQMIEKLLLILVALFIPLLSTQPQAPILAACVVIAGSALLVCTCRPYNDQLEDLMDCVAAIANTVNALVALALAYDVQWLSNTTSNSILIVANGATILSFVIAFALVPTRALVHAKNTKAKELKDQEKAKVEAKESNEQRIARKKNRESQQPGGIIPVSESEMLRAKRISSQDVHLLTRLTHSVSNEQAPISPFEMIRDTTEDQVQEASIVGQGELSSKKGQRDSFSPGQSIKLDRASSEVQLPVQNEHQRASSSISRHHRKQSQFSMPSINEGSVIFVEDVKLNPTPLVQSRLSLSASEQRKLRSTSGHHRSQSVIVNMTSHLSPLATPNMYQHSLSCNKRERAFSVFQTPVVEKRDNSPPRCNAISLQPSRRTSTSQVPTAAKSACASPHSGSISSQRPRNLSVSLEHEHSSPMARQFAIHEMERHPLKRRHVRSLSQM